jgi:hypothetical protein
VYVDESGDFNMEILNAISGFFRSYGIDPLLGGFICGIIVGALVRVGIASRKSEEWNSFKRSQIYCDRYSGSSMRIRININGEEKELGSAESYEIINALRSRNKIEAIKLLRESTGLSLKEAKDLVEIIEKDNVQ